MSKFNEYKKLDLVAFSSNVLEFWEKNNIFKKSIKQKSESNGFVFYEGPPSANGLPGIHHVMARAIKDIFCRYQTLKGKRVYRKAGWDTHGLPVELGVEKELQITKEDIGKKITVEAYNEECKKAVLRYTGIWNDLTKKMGYWVDLTDPYITFDSKYMESVWWLLKEIYKKQFLYKGYTIQPYSPKAGTGLSSHELNLPGTYQEVTDTTIVVQFKAIKKSSPLLQNIEGEVHFLAWTTTPWTLPSNTALTVGKNIEYVLIKTFNQYTHLPINVIIAKNLIKKQFSEKIFFESENNEDFNQYKKDTKIPYQLLIEFRGEAISGTKYEQLLAWEKPYENVENAFKVITGDFVTTEDGTGIVHTAPTFGSDDAKVAVENNVPALLVLDKKGNPIPLVDLQGKFINSLPKEYAGKYVKNEYYDQGKAPEKSVDVQIAIQLKEENKAFKVEKYKHSYPHCWRTDKPILYYPLDSWFIKISSVKERMVELNNTINWKPKATGEGRFGNWLENANDWNLSRSRYWGIPLPIWRNKEGSEEKIIGSIEELINEIQISIKAGNMEENPFQGFISNDMSKENYNKVDLHKNIVDKIILTASDGLPMYREADLIDVWFDSGAMPYAQWHYPFENREFIDSQKKYPADFIAEGVDQTRGWFYTLHAISTLVFDKVAYKNVVSNGLVLDKNGQKMSKRLGNAVDPFETLNEYGPDATRWYMIANSPPWENLKFDVEGIDEVRRKFFGTLYNTYSFFALYANVDGFTFKERSIPLNNRSELDQWILSELNTLIQQVDEFYSDYEPTKVARAIQDFVIDNLSNWYVRLSRRRFWKGEYTEDKIAAYQTLYECLITITKLASPIAPFYMDKLYQDLNSITNLEKHESVHLADFPIIDSFAINLPLQERIGIAQKITSMVFALRKKENIKVRQPLQKIMVPVLSQEMKNNLLQVQEIIKQEVNVKEIQLLTNKEASDIIIKQIKPNFKVLGPRLGKNVKSFTSIVSELTNEEINKLESNGKIALNIDGVEKEFDITDFEITTKDIPGWRVQSNGKLTVALDITITDELNNEGLARELVNRIQNLRKEKGLDIIDKIEITIETNKIIIDAINQNKKYICEETLAHDIIISKEIKNGTIVDIEQQTIKVIINKI